MVAVLQQQGAAPQGITGGGNDSTLRVPVTATPPQPEREQRAPSPIASLSETAQFIYHHYETIASLQEAVGTFQQQSSGNSAQQRAIDTFLRQIDRQEAELTEKITTLSQDALSQLASELHAMGVSTTTPVAIRAAAYMRELSTQPPDTAELATRFFHFRELLQQLPQNVTSPAALPSSLAEINALHSQTQSLVRRTVEGHLAGCSPEDRQEFFRNVSKVLNQSEGLSGISAQIRVMETIAATFPEEVTLSTPPRPTSSFFRDAELRELARRSREEVLRSGEVPNPIDAAPPPEPTVVRSEEIYSRIATDLHSSGLASVEESLRKLSLNPFRERNITEVFRHEIESSSQVLLNAIDSVAPTSRQQRQVFGNRILQDPTLPSNWNYDAETSRWVDQYEVSKVKLEWYLESGRLSLGTSSPDTGSLPNSEPHHPTVVASLPQSYGVSRSTPETYTPTVIQDRDLLRREIAQPHTSATPLAALQLERSPVEAALPNGLNTALKLCAVLQDLKSELKDITTLTPLEQFDVDSGVVSLTDTLRRKESTWPMSLYGIERFKPGGFKTATTVQLPYEARIEGLEALFHRAQERISRGSIPDSDGRIQDNSSSTVLREVIREVEDTLSRWRTQQTPEDLERYRAWYVEASDPLGLGVEYRTAIESYLSGSD